MIPPAVRDYLEAHRQERLADLKELLSIPSIANIHDRPDSCQRAARWLADYLKGIGLDILWPQIAALAVMGLTTMSLVVRKFNKTIA